MKNDNYRQPQYKTQGNESKEDKQMKTLHWQSKANEQNLPPKVSLLVYN